MYKQQIYQIAELNRIEKIDSVARIESNRIETFLSELECSSVYVCVPTRWRLKSAGIDIEQNYITVTLCVVQS